MSPTHSNYRNNDFEYDIESLLETRAEFATHGGPSGRVSNRPTRQTARSKKRRAEGHNGIQRRRNKHWSW